MCFCACVLGGCSVAVLGTVAAAPSSWPKQTLPYPPGVATPMQCHGGHSRCGTRTGGRLSGHGALQSQPGHAPASRAARGAGLRGRGAGHGAGHDARRRAAGSQPACRSGRGTRPQPRSHATQPPGGNRRVESRQGAVSHGAASKRRALGVHQSVRGWVFESAGLGRQGMGQRRWATDAAGPLGCRSGAATDVVNLLAWPR